MATDLILGPTPLGLVHPTQMREDRFGRLCVGGAELPRVTVVGRLETETGFFFCDFSIESKQPPFLNKELAIGVSQQGLWNWDVVEVFLQPNVSSSTYYEFVVSPLGQHFELEVFEPRRRVNPLFRSGARISAVMGTGGWRSSIKVDLRKIGWAPLTGRLKWNCFAILGQPDSAPGRSYWSLNLPEQTEPDFHLPQYFTPLD